jgi:tetratricopeptide (TPR) repeat protein
MAQRQRFQRKDLKHDEIMEAAFDFGHWVEENWRRVAMGAGAVVMIVAIVLVWVWYARQSRLESEQLLAAGQRSYEAAAQNNFMNDDDLADALAAFDGLVERSPNAPTGRVALYYRGATLQQLGRVDEAIGSLEQLTGAGDNDPTLQATGEALLANLYAQGGRTSDAVALLNRIAGQDSPALPPELALLRMGQIQEEDGDFEAARATWQRIVRDYPETAGAGEARRRLGPDASR